MPIVENFVFLQLKIQFMPRKKHKKQNEVRTLPNVFSDFENDSTREKFNHWVDKNVFTLELGCGNGEYSIALANSYPHRKFVGVDRAGARIWNAAKTALNNEVSNVVFFLTYVEKLNNLLSDGIVDEIWIPFPNPLPHRRLMKKIIINPHYLEVYNKILIKGGKIHLKTDDQFLFDYANEIVIKSKLSVHHSVDNLYLTNGLPDEAYISTRFEKQHIDAGKTIKYLSFSFE